ncbi:Uma2 family endonuclease [Leptolyngbya sp. FACHB-36]|uniref:Uma2 family endonuclease n=1 Tax=Leptolyngbya sp. FACHB-36 TaxID=2692808 RepID=UPI0016806E21|nr:Uma2 family endonuclease [Leptolyngbya sp. FACHB-36]MBD2021700.1 Uma2 family endonuclease [Leptolyngbya sp. FACHB-36]
MSTETVPNQEFQPVVEPEWNFPEPPTDLIFDDGEPLETNRHRHAVNVLIDSALTALESRSDVFVGGNMFVYYSRDQAMNRDFRGPDVFVALDVDGSRERQGWVTWEEGGRYPDVIIELLSPSTAAVDKGVKKDLYERTFRTADYFIFDPFDRDSLQGWHLDASQRYQPLSADDRGWLWCETLQLWLGTWEGSVRREPPTGTCYWLRFYDQQGNLVLMQNEAAQQQADAAQQQAEQERQRAEQERQRAERLANRLRELGEDPDQL